VKRKQPRASVLLEIPDCRMEASVTSDRQIMFNLGWPHDTTTLIFQRRRALRRFIRVATDVLAGSIPPGASDVDPEIVSAPD
jgi:hypothetical protein